MLPTGAYTRFLSLGSFGSLLFLLFLGWLLTMLKTGKIPFCGMDLVRKDQTFSAEGSPPPSPQPSVSVAWLQPQNSWGLVNLTVKLSPVRARPAQAAPAPAGLPVHVFFSLPLPSAAADGVETWEKTAGVDRSEPRVRGWRRFGLSSHWEFSLPKCPVDDGDGPRALQILRTLSTLSTLRSLRSLRTRTNALLP